MTCNVASHNITCLHAVGGLVYIVSDDALSRVYYRQLTTVTYATDETIDVWLLAV